MFTAVQHKEKYSYLIFALLIVGSIVIRLPILTEPWGADQSEYGYVAKGILEGKVTKKQEQEIRAVVLRAVKQYGELFKRLSTHPLGG